MPALDDIDAWRALPFCVDGYGHMVIDPRLRASIAPEHRDRLGL